MDKELLYPVYYTNKHFLTLYTMELSFMKDI